MLVDVVVVKVEATALLVSLLKTRPHWFEVVMLVEEPWAQAAAGPMA
jgi:hypothetical protein